MNHTFSLFDFEIWNFLKTDSLKIWLFSHWFHKYALIPHKICKFQASFRNSLHQYAVTLLTIDKPLTFLQIPSKICKFFSIYYYYLFIFFLKRELILPKILKFAIFWQLNFLKCAVCVCICYWLQEYMITSINWLNSSLFMIKVAKI